MGMTLSSDIYWETRLSHCPLERGGYVGRARHCGTGRPALI